MTGPDQILTSRTFMQVYAQEAEAQQEKMRLSLEYDLFGPNRLDWRKRKKLLRKARQRGAAKFFEKYGR